LDCSLATIWRKVRSGEFPPPLRIAERIVVFHVPTVEAAIAKRQSDDGAAARSRSRMAKIAEASSAAAAKRRAERAAALEAVSRKPAIAEALEAA
jgi:hypothetical protein